MEMVAYTGDVILEHWWWGNLGIDLNGVIFDRSIYPILEDHDTDKKIAWSNVPAVSENGITYSPDIIHFVDTEESEEFRKLSSQGFPYQASVYIIPTELEFIDEGETGEANGREVIGPGTIFRKCIFQESSVCVFGWDGKTSSTAYSQEPGTELKLSVKGERKMPDKTKKRQKLQNVDYSQYNDQASCEGAGGTWNGTACSAPQNQMAEDYSQYNDQTTCESHGGVWDNNTCKSPSAAALATDYSQYTDQTSCESAGGRWDGNVCSAPDANATQDTTVQLTDYSQHNDQSSCEGAGGVWSNNICKAPNAVLAELIAVVNKLTEGEGGDDVTSKTDEGSCTAAGGHWYDGSCHAEPKPADSAAMSEAAMTKLNKVYEMKLKELQTAYEGKFSQAEQKIAKLEKEAEIAKLSAAKSKADRIWATQFSESDIHPNLQNKIRKSVNYLQYVKDGNLDHVRFAAAVKDEIADWEDLNVIQGTGFGMKSSDDSDKNSKFSADADALVDDLLGRAGQKKK